MIVNIRKSETAGHGPVGLLVVNVRVTLPDEISAALGVYVVVRLPALPKLPVPEVLHVAEVAEPSIVPANEAGVLEHIV